jgi:hypothetical protein
MPSLTVRALSEMLRLPAYAQMRILSDQKYPKKEPQVFRTPYYRPALNGIRSFYKTGNQAAALNAALTKIQGISQDAKRLNNARAIDSFRKSSAARRIFVVTVSPHLAHAINNVEFRLSPDLRVLEDGKPRVLFFNCRAEKLDPELARCTIEVAHWVLENSGTNLPVSGIEFIDLSTGKTHTTKTRRAATVKAVRANVQVISALWDSL